VGVAVVAVLVRLPMLGLPLDSDEGGYAYVARRWAAGATLYTPGAWVDRPPGLALVFRWTGDIAYSPTALRSAAALAAVAVALAVFVAAHSLAGPGAACLAGGLAGLILAGPYIQGYELNGELLAAAFGAWAVAVALVWRASRPGLAWLILAGMLAGVAPLLKQSALDALVVVLAVAVDAAIGSRRWRPALAALGGVAVPLGATAAWAGVTGWDRAWYAIVGFQAGLVRNEPVATRLSALAASAAHAAPDLAGLALAAAAGAILVWRRQRWQLWPHVLWVASALLAVVIGPFGHPHYWVQVVAPLAVLAACCWPALRRTGTAPGAAALGGPARAVVGVTLALAVTVPLLAGAYVVSRSPSERAVLLSPDQRQVADPTVAAWLRSHTSPYQQVYAFVASADLYMLAGRGTSYPYLWEASVQHVPGALQVLDAYLASPGGPRYIVEYQQPDLIDSTGRLRSVVAEHYARVASIGGYAVLVRRLPPVGRSSSRTR
jgi:hypothetical protein